MQSLREIVVANKLFTVLGFVRGTPLGL